MKFFQEPRANPKLVEVFSAFGMDGSQGNPYEGKSAEELSSMKAMAESEAEWEKMAELLPNDLPGDDSAPPVTRETTWFKSFDGTSRALYIFRPEQSPTGPRPCVVYMHGGAMVAGHTANKVHVQWCTSLARHGVVAVAVDFRNAYERGRRHPFPTGLHDCAAAVRWIELRKAALGIGRIVLTGESGGANLCLATALKAKREGWVGEIAGVYGLAPYISNAYAWSDGRKMAELPSLYECDGYWLYTDQMAGLAAFYSPGDEENPLAWPYFATVEDCVGLPPHILQMDELDPLRDEGIAYYRKLLAAGVSVHAQVNLGLVHRSALVFRKLLPEVHDKAIRDIASFAKSL
jgi:acetyl esterase/lipase